MAAASSASRARYSDGRSRKWTSAFAASPIRSGKFSRPPKNQTRRPTPSPTASPRNVSRNGRVTPAGARKPPSELFLFRRLVEIFHVGRRRLALLRRADGAAAVGGRRIARGKRILALPIHPFAVLMMLTFCRLCFWQMNVFGCVGHGGPPVCGKGTGSTAPGSKSGEGTLEHLRPKTDNTNNDQVDRHKIIQQPRQEQNQDTENEGQQGLDDYDIDAGHRNAPLRGFNRHNNANDGCWMLNAARPRAARRPVEQFDLSLIHI